MCAARAAGVSWPVMYRAHAPPDPATPSPPRVVVDGLSAAYGDAVVLRAVSFALAPGAVYGLVGPNGAGKSTLLRCLAGLHPALKGSVRVGGEVVDARAPVRGRVALMPDRPPAWEKLTVREQLAYTARIDGLDELEIARRADHWLPRVGLGGHGAVPVRALSLGQRQRLGLAQTLLRGADFVMLDEPANGMDPDARAMLAAVLREAAAAGATVLLSSHVLAELDALCDAFVVLAQGRVAGVGSAHELNGADRGTVTVAVGLLVPAEPLRARAAEAVASVDGATLSLVSGNDLRVQVPEDPETHARLLRALMNAALPVTSFATERPQIASLYTHLSHRAGDTP